MKSSDVILAACTLSLPCFNGVAQARVAPQGTPKNILFILVDDLGWNDLGFMGSEYYETPNIDRLAASGVVFTDGYAACQVSSPSRASIMTGLYTTRHGVTDWIGEKAGEAWRDMGRHTKLLPSEYDLYLDPKFDIIPEKLKSEGYATFFAGKWHLGGEEQYLPDSNGFDINKGGWEAGGPKGGYFSPYANPKLEDGPAGENLSMRLAEETVAFIEDHNSNSSDQPFFAYLSFYAVHASIETTQEYWSYFRDKAERMGIAESGFIVDRTLPVRQCQDNPIYAGLIKQMDDAVGRVLDAIDELGLDENTLIVFTSDNGGVTSGDAYSTSLLPLRGGKGRQFEGGIRVPVVIKSPQSPLNGESCSTPVHGIDFYPTLMSYAGVDMGTTFVDGVDVTPLLRGEQIAERSLFWHYPHYGNQGGEPSSIIRKGDWKLIYYHEDLRCELYNLKQDLSESEYVTAQNRDKAEELKEELLAWLEQTQALIPEPDMKYDPVAESKYKEEMRTKVLQQKESFRRSSLEKGFKPNVTWWGSQVGQMQEE
ncbi:MAG: sulfatase [Rikenellaceae bacterium]